MNKPADAPETPGAVRPSPRSLHRLVRRYFTDPEASSTKRLAETALQTAREMETTRGRKDNFWLIEEAAGALIALAARMLPQYAGRLYFPPDETRVTGNRTAKAARIYFRTQTPTAQQTATLALRANALAIEIFRQEPDRDQDYEDEIRHTWIAIGESLQKRQEEGSPDEAEQL